MSLREGGAPLARIALLSALILFVEMLLVRWVGTELRVFAYLQNAVLVAAFLGLGLGCRNARAPVRLLPAMVALVSIALVLDDPWGWELGEGITRGLVAFQDSVVWYASMGPAWPQYVRTAMVVFALTLSLALLAAIAVVFRPLGQWLGAWMDAHPRPIAAYSANILGSLFGIALFVWATVQGTRPFLWLLVAGLGLAATAAWARDGRVARAASVGLALSLPLFAWHEPFPTLWSPYQKLSLHPLGFPAPQGGFRTCGEVINVNNVGYQSMVNLDAGHMAAEPGSYPPHEIRTSHYILPYELVGARQDVLVVGSGAGNDVAAALRAGARKVQAVEIDPVIVDLGRARHPNRPYASPRVQVTIDDARAFFHKAPGGAYDLVWFGLLDSHTTPSAYANVRLDHFVYTRESFADVQRLLRDSGVVVLFFAPQTPWISARLVGLLTETFGAPPLALRAGSSSPCLGWGGFLLVGGREDALASIRARAQQDDDMRIRLIDISTLPLQTPLTTDNWPYLYLPSPGIPRYHLLVGLACLVVGLLLRGALFKQGESIDLTMLLLGMGFMLLEVTGVSRAALLFGTTWTVNAYVVAAIFAMILLANLVASRVAVAPLGWPAAGLVLSIFALAVVPTARLAALPLAARVIVGGGFLAVPVFFSGLIFVSAWARAERKDLALGSNLLGSLLGGVASMLSMAVGFRLLTFLTLVVYLGALLAMRLQGVGTPAAAAPAPAN
jgi:SAM-dependent methyltransferase